MIAENVPEVVLEIEKTRKDGGECKSFYDTDGFTYG